MSQVEPQPYTTAPSNYHLQFDRDALPLSLRVDDPETGMSCSHGLTCISGIVPKNGKTVSHYTYIFNRGTILPLRISPSMGRIPKLVPPPDRPPRLRHSYLMTLYVYSYATLLSG